MGRLFAGGGISVGVVALLSLPFTGSQIPVLWLLPQYFNTVTSYPYASVNAFNWMAFWGGNWQSETAGFLFLSWKGWGILSILLLTGALVFFALRDRARRLSLPLLAAWYGCGVFLFAHRMHERYLLPALVLLLTARALTKDRRLDPAALLLTLSLLLNMVVVYACAEQNPFLEGSLCGVLIRLGALLTLIAFVLLVRILLRPPLTGDAAPRPQSVRRAAQHPPHPHPSICPAGRGRAGAADPLRRLPVAALSGYHRGARDRLCRRCGGAHPHGHAAGGQQRRQHLDLPRHHRGDTDRCRRGGQPGLRIHPRRRRLLLLAAAGDSAHRRQFHHLLLRGHGQ